MSEDDFVPEASDEPKPKRKYTRRTIYADPALNEAANEAIESFIDTHIADDADVGIEVEPIEPFDAPTQEVKLLNPIPENNSLKAKVERFLGINCPMELKPWRGVDHWRCTKCSFSTFKADIAKDHRC